MIAGIAPTHCLSPLASRLRRAFTLVEIMIVVAIIGLIVTMAMPNLYQTASKKGMRRAITDLKDVCGNARAQAIFSGKPVSVKFYPIERRFEMVGGGGAAAVDPVTGEAKGGSNPGNAPNTETKGIFPEDIMVEMLDVNMFEYKDSDWAEVRFSERGTSDEMTIILRDADNKYRKIILEPTTGLIFIGEPKDDLTR